MNGFVILGALIAAFATSFVASKLNRNPYTWGIAGFFFGIVTLLVLTCVHVLSENNNMKE